jgi:hypothetical protein
MKCDLNKEISFSTFSTFFPVKIANLPGMQLNYRVLSLCTLLSLLLAEF